MLTVTVAVSALLLSSCGQSRGEAEAAAVAAAEKTTPAPARVIATETLCDGGWQATVSIYSNGEGEFPMGIHRSDPGKRCDPENFTKIRTPVPTNSDS
jgi:hypothetical protein